MILVETNAGHGAGKPTSKKVIHNFYWNRILVNSRLIFFWYLQIAESVDMFSFMVQALHLEIVPKYRSQWIDCIT